MQDEGAADAFTSKADVYSFAIVLWQILTCKVPYVGLHFSRVLFSVVNCQLRPEMPNGRFPAGLLPPYQDEVLTTLLSKCWAQDPTERPDLDKVLQVLAQLGAI